MENSKKLGNLNTSEPQVLRKAEIARILNNVKQASFNAKEGNNSDNNFKKRSLLDIALDASTSKVSQDNNHTQETSSEIENDNDQKNDDEIENQEENVSNFNEEDKKKLIEENNALAEKRIKEAEEIAFEKGRQEGIKEGHANGLSEARSQSQEGLDAAISIFRIAAETIENTDNSNLEILNDMVQQTIIEIAQESAGFLIDNFPEKFVQRINEFSRLINENIKKISLEMNKEDYEAIKEYVEKDDFLSSINIKHSINLPRGDMKLSADGINMNDFITFNNSILNNNYNKSETQTESETETTNQEDLKSPETQTESETETETTNQEDLKSPETQTESETETKTSNQEDLKSPETIEIDKESK